MQLNYFRQLQEINGNPVAMKLATEFLGESLSTLPEDIEHIYRAFCSSLEILPKYVEFKAHYLHTLLLNNYHHIQPWLHTLQLPDAFPIRLRFWALMTKLIRRKLSRQFPNELIQLDTLIKALPKLPDWFKESYPSIDHPIVKEHFRKTI